MSFSIVQVPFTVALHTVVWTLPLLGCSEESFVPAQADFHRVDSSHADATGTGGDLGRDMDANPDHRPDTGHVAPVEVIISDEMVSRWLRGVVLLGYCFGYFEQDITLDWGQFLITSAPLLTAAGASEAALTVPILRCLTTVQSCDDFFLCDGFRRSDPCAGVANDFPRCVGNRMQICRWGAPLLQDSDCDAYGAVCGADRSGFSICGREGCANGCDGHLLNWCSSSFTTVGSCANRMGCRWASDSIPDAYSKDDGPCIAYITQSCSEETESPRCAGDGAACDVSDAAPTCEGNILRRCAGGRISEVACQNLIEGMACVLDADNVPSCRYPDHDCNPNSTPATCTGTVLTVCPFGRQISIDCSELDSGVCAEFVLENGSGRAGCVRAP